MFSRCVLVSLVFMTVAGLPPFRRPTGPRSVTSLTRENLQDSSPWIKLNQFGNVLSQFPKIVSDIAEAGPKIETDSQKLQVINNVKDYIKENLKIQIKGDFLNIKGRNISNSLISEFSQTYSLPVRANPSYVTAVLTSDGYLVVRAPLGSATTKTNIEKNITITESEEPLHTQRVFGSPSDVPLYTQRVFDRPSNLPVLPQYKPVKSENTNTVTEVPQSHVESSKQSVFEKKDPISLPNTAPEPIQKTVVIEKNNLQNNVNEPITLEVPQKSQTQIISPTEISQRVDTKNEVIIPTTTLLQSSLESQNNIIKPSLDYQADPNNFNNLPTTNVIGPEKNDILQNYGENTEKKVITITDLPILQPSQELYTSEQLISLVEKEITPKTPVFQVSVTQNLVTEALQTQTDPSALEILESNYYNQNNDTFVGDLMSEQEEINMSKTNIFLNTPQYRSENDYLTTVLDSVRGKIADDAGLLQEVFLPEDNNFEPIEKNIKEKSANIQSAEVANDEISNVKSITEQSLSVTENLPSISETHSKSLRVEQVLPKEEIANYNTETGKSILIGDLSVSVTTNQPEPQTVMSNEEIFKDNIAVSKTDSIIEESLQLKSNQPEAGVVTPNEEKLNDNTAVTKTDSMIEGSVQVTTKQPEISTGNFTVSEVDTIKNESLPVTKNLPVNALSDSLILPEAPTSSNEEIANDNTVVNESDSAIDQSLPVTTNQLSNTESYSLILPEGQGIASHDIAVSGADLPIDQSLLVTTNQPTNTIDGISTIGNAYSIIDQALPVLMNQPDNTEIYLSTELETQDVASNEETTNNNIATNESGLIVDQSSLDRTIQANNSDLFFSNSPVVQTITSKEELLNNKAIIGSASTIDQLTNQSTNRDTNLVFLAEAQALASNEEILNDEIARIEAEESLSVTSNQPTISEAISTNDQNVQPLYLSDVKETNSSNSPVPQEATNQ